MEDQQRQHKRQSDLLRSLAEREHDRVQSIVAKTEEATIKSAEGAIRIVLLINGGAAVSVLAFIGSLASQGRVSFDRLNTIAGSLIWFGCGVGSAAICAFFFYLTNISYSYATGTQTRDYNHPYVHQTPCSRQWRCAGLIFHWTALLSAGAAFGFFVYGIVDVRNAIGFLAK